MGWIVVPNWEKFQHYKDRVPPWIKLHLEILDKPETADLSDAEFGLLVRIYALYARSRGTLRASYVQTYVGSRWTRRHLEALNDAGLIRLVASKPLALEKEVLREE